MKTIYNKIGAALMGILLLASCQNRDLPGSGAMQLPTPDVTTISGTASGPYEYDYTLSWSGVPTGAQMQVGVFKNGSQIQGLTTVDGNSFTLKTWSLTSSMSSSSNIPMATLPLRE